MQSASRTISPPPRYSTPLAGDIILCGSSWNIHAQCILRLGQKASFSHAAVMCGLNFGVQAMPESGVDAFSLHDFLNRQAVGTPWQVFRHKDLDTRAAGGGDADVMLRFREAAKYFMNQSYNFWIHFPERRSRTDDSGSSFCSQLVARVHEKAWGLRPDNRLLTSTVLPTDLQTQFVDNDDWIEVTSIYADRMAWVISHDHLTARIKSDEESIKILRNDLQISLATQEQFISDEAMLTEVESSLVSLQATVDRMHQQITDKQLPRQPPLDMTSHLVEAVKRGATSNWRTHRMFKRHRWLRRWRAVWLMLKRMWSAG